MACLYVFPACPAEMILTLQWKSGKLPILTKFVQFKSVMIMTGQFLSSMVGWCSQPVLWWSPLVYHDCRDVFSGHDSKSMGQDDVTVMGKHGSNYRLPLSCNRKRQKV